MQTIHSERDLDDLRRSAQTWAVVTAWGKNGLFDALSDGAPHSASDLPGDTRSIEITATLLGHIGLLIRHEGETGNPQWSLSATARELLAQGCLTIPRSTGIAELSRLTDVLKEGGPVRDDEGQRRATAIGVDPDNPEGARMFMNMLYRRSAVAAGETARLLAARLPQGGRALDLGGGHGRYGEELAQKGFEVTLFDQPVCVEVARERYGDSQRYIAGDFMVDDLGGPYDLVLGSNIVHGLSDPDLAHLHPRLREVIRPGGLLVWKDMFLDDTAIGPESAAVFGIMMLMYTEGGRSYSVQEMERILASAGFESLQHVLVADQRFSLVIGW